MMKHVLQQFFLTILALSVSLSLQAADTVASPSNTQIKPTANAIIRVNYVCKYREDVDSKPNSSGKLLYPKDYILVKINPADLDSAKRNLDQYRLWIDGICFPNMRAHFINESEPGLIFQLERDTAENSPWQLMYSNPSYWHFKHLVNVNLGTLTTEYRMPGRTHRIYLFTSIAWVPWVFYPLFALLVVLIIKYGQAFLKDTTLYSSSGVKIGYQTSEATNAEAGIINIKEVPYSLARFQFLLWLIVIFFGIVHIWIITDVLTSPSGSTLLLLGISGGTFYLGKMLDTPSGGGTLTATESVQAFISNNRQSKGLVYDMLNDGKSISLHRLQLLLFTVFLSCYFIMEVVGGLIIPQIDQTMLALMGISSTMYAGVKTTES